MLEMNSDIPDANAEATSFVRVIKSYRNVVAICDSDLVGKFFHEDNLELNVKENFFKGEEMSKNELIELIQNMSEEDATFNIVGENSVNAAIMAGIISKKEVKKVQRVPFALVLN